MQPFSIAVGRSIFMDNGRYACAQCLGCPAMQMGVPTLQLFARRCREPVGPKALELGLPNTKHIVEVMLPCSMQPAKMVDGLIITETVPVLISFTK